MLLDQHMKAVGCNVDSELLAVAAADLVLTSAFYVLNQESHTSDSEEVKAAPKAFKDVKAAVVASEKDSVSELSPGFDATQVLPGHSALHFHFLRKLLFL